MDYLISVLCVMLLCVKRDIPHSRRSEDGYCLRCLDGFGLLGRDMQISFELLQLLGTVAPSFVTVGTSGFFCGDCEMFQCLGTVIDSRHGGGQRAKELTNEDRDSDEHGDTPYKVERWTDIQTYRDSGKKG